MMRLIVDWVRVGQAGAMEQTPDGFEESARIVEAFAEGETDPRVLDLLNAIIKAIRDKAVDN